jgi:hypothetical protein
VHDVVAVQIGQPADELAEHDACVILLIAPLLTQRLSEKRAWGTPHRRQGHARRGIGKG